MDKKSKIFFWIFFALMGISVLLAYYRTMILRDYPLTESVVEE